MNLLFVSLFALSPLATIRAFTPQQHKASSSTRPVSTTAAQSSIGAPNEKPLTDPFGLYGKNSEEYKQGRLQPLESVDPTSDATDRSIQDPFKLYVDQSTVDSTVLMSPSLPFLEQPALLQGIPGNRGFDPFKFASSSPESLRWYREAEIKHARLAMLATVGWVASELLDGSLARAIGSPMLLDLHNRVPSVLNGGLTQTPAAFWAASLGVAFAIETFGMLTSNDNVIPGNLGFDPLGLFGKTPEQRFAKLESELFNGRLAMMAITAFAATEWWTQVPIVH